jgi:hypothetical protein
MGDVYVERAAAHNWSLYDISRDLERGHIRPWDELAEQGPVGRVQEGGTYIFAPNPQEGETTRDAVRRQGGIGAYLRIREIDSPDYAGIRLTCSPNYAFFTRLAMEAAHVHLYSYTPPNVLATDEVYLHHVSAAAVFARDFGVMTGPQFQAEYAKWH